MTKVVVPQTPEGRARKAARQRGLPAGAGPEQLEQWVEERAVKEVLKALVLEVAALKVGRR